MYGTSSRLTMNPGVSCHKKIAITSDSIIGYRLSKHYNLAVNCRLAKRLSEVNQGFKRRFTCFWSTHNLKYWKAHDILLTLYKLLKNSIKRIELINEAALWVTDCISPGALARVVTVSVEPRRVSWLEPDWRSGDLQNDPVARLAQIYLLLAAMTCYSQRLFL